MLDNAASPATNQVLQLLEESVNLKRVIGTKLNQGDVNRVQENVNKPFICHLRESISKSFGFFPGNCHGVKL